MVYDSPEIYIYSMSFRSLEAAGMSLMSLSKMKDNNERTVTSNFIVNITNKSVVKASTPLPDPQILAVSNLDLLSGRFPITYLYFYLPKINGMTFESAVTKLKSSLSETLTHFYPFAGRIVQNAETGEPEICCDNNGALVIEASAEVGLGEVDLYNLDRILKDKLVASFEQLDSHPIQVQVTKYACGGLSLTLTFDHLLGDASAFGKFLCSWSEVARDKTMSCVPDHSRQRLSARCPPTYHPSLDQTFVKCTLQEIENIPTRTVLVKRLYHVDASSIDQLQELASLGEEKMTKIEAFSAYVWKLMTKAVDQNAHSNCKMGWLVDGRTRMFLGKENDNQYMSNYIGNVLSLAVGEASLNDLNHKSLAYIASMVHSVISTSTTEDHFMDLIDWIECRRPGLMLARMVLGGGSVPGLVISSGRRFPVSEVDFGFGRPVLGTVSSVIERIGVAYLNQRPSARGDGSWCVSAILWPELAAALECDSIFQLMSPSHLFDSQ